MKKIKSYTSIWSVEKVIYAINDFQLPFPPLTFSQMAWFVVSLFVVILFGRSRKLTQDFRNPKGFFPSKVFCDTNQVKATGIPKYLRNAPSIKEKGGSSPKRITTNSDTTNHAI